MSSNNNNNRLSTSQTTDLRNIVFYAKVEKLDVKSDTKANSTTKGYNGTSFVAGGISAAVAATLTCPLDVIKTRQQSSTNIFVNNCKHNYFQTRKVHMVHSNRLAMRSRFFLIPTYKYGFLQNASSILHLRSMLKFEGVRSLFKGLGATLIGVVPSRSIQFFMYENSKQFFSSNLNVEADSSRLHMMSSIVAGLCSTTFTSPIFVVKTKQQLHKRHNNSVLTASQCCKEIIKTNGLRGFFRGLSASYAGIVETMLYLTTYEKFKKTYFGHNNINKDKLSTKDFAYLMMFSSVAKTFACILAYPHEVVRTRLREETCKTNYKGFFQTLHTVGKEEGIRALYRGLPIQVVRQVPNMAIFMGVYEGIIYWTGAKK